jgi:EAL domain-containing protein (putative c-di-GMP-specific phosphodiesterase class I)
LDEGYGMKMSVNISPIQVIQDDFVPMVKEIIQTFEIDPAFIELEITESVFLSNYELVNSKLKVLREMGLSIAIDDFGTGYSSFARLKELHVDSVKIDQYFIRRITKLDPSELITGDIISMVHKFGLSTVAEGVESREEKEYLVSQGCDVLQGYYYSRPLIEKEILFYIANKNVN